MAEMQPTMEILKKIRKNSGQNKDEVFTRLYRYMLRKDLYYLAYIAVVCKYLQTKSQG